MGNLMIAYANSAADRWAAQVVAASLDAAVLLALAGLVWLAIRNRVAPRVGYWGLILLAAVSVPHLRAAGEATPDHPQAPAAEAPARPAQEFELSVVGPDGKPIPGATVELRGDPLPTPDRIRKGKVTGQQLHGIFVATDDAGRLVVEFPRAPGRLGVFITIPGYGPYCARWSSANHDEPIPRPLHGRARGGLVGRGNHRRSRRQAGRRRGGPPQHRVQEAPRRHPAIRQRREGDDRRRGPLALRQRAGLDGQGPRGDQPPELHADPPVSRRAANSASSPAGEPSSKIVLDRGLTVTGKVTDEAGKPIAGALVRTKFSNDVREARTGPDGVYTLVGCEPKPVHLVVSAMGRATDMKELNIEPGMGPVDFRMKPGGTVRIRVLDEQGNPVPRARIFFQEWRGRYQYFEFDHVNQYADDKGVWVWHEAPVDEFRADICPPGGMVLHRQPLIAREAEYVFRAPGPLVVSGKVIDAVTREPIKAFRVVPGDGAIRGRCSGTGKTASSPPTAITRSARPGAIRRT